MIEDLTVEVGEGEAARENLGKSVSKSVSESESVSVGVDDGLEDHSVVPDEAQHHLLEVLTRRNRAPGSSVGLDVV